MADLKKSQLIFLLLITIIAAVSAGRPCKTLFISSYSFSVHRLPQQPSGFVTVLTEISQTRPLFLIADDREDDAERVRSSGNDIPSFDWPYDLSSLRDRTKDILSVVVALLFGVGFGALTAATMYLVWSLFADPRPAGDDDFYDGFSSSSDDDVFSPKKGGYVKIPADSIEKVEKSAVV